MKILLASLLLALAATTRAAEPMADPDAWSVARLMDLGINIGNTLDNTTTWETGWGNPPITREYVEQLAALGFRVVRVSVAWDTYANDGQISSDKLARVQQVADWITSAGMYCVVNIHWDGGWIDAGHFFGAGAERKFVGYWRQIASYFANYNPRLIFEALNEETNFSAAGSQKKAYETLAHVNQLFIDTVRATGGKNATRVLIVTGYSTDFAKTASVDYLLPRDPVPHRLMISVHYYTPWQFVGMTKDESWGRMRTSWGTRDDIAEMNRLFDGMQEFCKRHDLPAFIGEFGVTDKREPAPRVKWMAEVIHAAFARRMVPVLWDTGGDVSRKPPYAPSAALGAVLELIRKTQQE
jgi:endoglucanase